MCLRAHFCGNSQSLFKNWLAVSYFFFTRTQHLNTWVCTCLAHTHIEYAVCICHTLQWIDKLYIYLSIKFSGMFSSNYWFVTLVWMDWKDEFNWLHVYCVVCVCVCFSVSWPISTSAKQFTQIPSQLLKPFSSSFLWRFFFDRPFSLTINSF